LPEPVLFGLHLRALQVDLVESARKVLLVLLERDAGLVEIARDLLVTQHDLLDEGRPVEKVGDALGGQEPVDVDPVAGPVCGVHAGSQRVGLRGVVGLHRDDLLLLLSDPAAQQGDLLLQARAPLAGGPDLALQRADLGCDRCDLGLELARLGDERVGLLLLGRGQAACGVGGLTVAVEVVPRHREGGRRQHERREEGEAEEDSKRRCATHAATHLRRAATIRTTIAPRCGIHRI
jgi:hypothetical protein